MGFHYPNSPLLECTIVSRGWRAVALPMLWSYIRFDFHAKTRDRSKRLAHVLINARSATSYGGDDYPSFVRRIGLYWLPYGLDWGDETTPLVLRALDLLQPSQIQSFNIQLPLIIGSDAVYKILPTVYKILPTVSRLLNNVRSFKLAYMSAQDGDSLMQRLPASLEKLELMGDYRYCQRSYSTHDHNLTFPSHLNLRALLLNHVHTLRSDHLARSLRTWSTHLQQLTINRCRNIYTSEVIGALTAHCPNLAWLNLLNRFPDNEPQGITEVALCGLIDRCRALRVLKLDRIQGATERFLAHCAAHGHTLRELSIVDCAATTGERVMDVDAWRSLESLTVYGLPMVDPFSREQIDEKFVRIVKEGCPALRQCQLGRGPLDDQRSLLGMV